MAKATPGQKVVLLAALTKEQVQTDTTTSDSYIDLSSLDAAREWGIHLSSVTCFTLTENATANFRWKLGFFWSIDGRKWSATPIDLFSFISANGDVIQTAVTSGFAPLMRYVLIVKNASGAALERGVLTCGVAFEFKS